MNRMLGDLLRRLLTDRFDRELASRPRLDDRAFDEAYDAGSGIPEHISIRLRRVYAERLGQGWMAVRYGNVERPVEVLGLAL